MGHAKLKFVKKSDDVIVILILWRHIHFYVSQHLKLLTLSILIGSSSNLVWVHYGTLISNFQLKNLIKCQDLKKKGTILWFWSSTVSIDGHHGNKETPILKLLIWKIAYRCMIKVTKFGEDRLNCFWVKATSHSSIFDIPMRPLREDQKHRHRFTR